MDYFSAAMDQYHGRMSNVDLDRLRPDTIHWDLRKKREGGDKQKHSDNYGEDGK